MHTPGRPEHGPRSNAVDAPQMAALSRVHAPNPTEADAHDSPNHVMRYQRWFQLVSAASLGTYLCVPSSRRLFSVLASSRVIALQRQGRQCDSSVPLRGDSRSRPSSPHRETMARVEASARRRHVRGAQHKRVIVCVAPAPGRPCMERRPGLQTHRYPLTGSCFTAAGGSRPTSTASALTAGTTPSGEENI